MGFLLKGICIGLLFGLPAGAVGALTVQRTLHSGAKAGLFTGLGSSAADCLYASIGVFGLTFISDFLLRFQTAIHLLGGGLVLFMGVRLLIKKEIAAGAAPQAIGFAGMFLSDGLLLVCGVFAGTYLWWGALTVGAGFVGKRIDKVNLWGINRVFGGILCLLGIVVFFRLIFER